MSVNTKKIQREGQITTTSKSNKDYALERHKEDVKRLQAQIDTLEGDLK